MKTSVLQSDEFAPFYAGYIERAGDIELISGLKQNLRSALDLYYTIPEGSYDFSYAEGKWSIKEVLQHLIDSERVFAYRAMRIARKDKISLPGYSQDDFVMYSNANSRSKDDLINEYKTVRTATIALFESFNETMLSEKGIANDSPTSVRAIGFIIIGHENHHVNIIMERYL